MRNKARFEFVDQFRKINTLEKLQPIESFFPDDLEEGKQENNKFIRYKEEMTLEDREKYEELLFQNEIITSYKEDIEPECNERFKNRNANITQDIDYYKNWSQELNQEIKMRDYKHKFFFRDAQPPPRLKEESAVSARKTEEEKINERTTQNEEDANIELPQRGKYNFHEITRRLYNNDNAKEDKESSFLRDLSIKNEIAELRKLKNLDQIEKIGDFNEEFAKFNYYIEPHPDPVDIQFVDNSILRGSNALSLDYFRDIGAPARDLSRYTAHNHARMKMRGQEEQSLQLEQAYNQQKRELLYLYFLRDEQLKINKNEMSFFDLANISMGRITSNNAHMCVRNEKVTKAQYMKLLKKMEKYDLRENEAGKPRNDKEVGTEDLEDLNLPQRENDHQEGDDNPDIQRIIEEINNIRREVKMLEDGNSLNNFNRPNFNNEIYIKLEHLLNILYDMVTEKLARRPPLEQIKDHISQIDGRNELGYERIRLLWFVANCYDEMISKQHKTLDLRSMAGRNNKAAPEILKYKGTKIIAQETLQPKKVYGFNQKKAPNAKTPTKGQARPSPLSVTPNKAKLATNSKLNTSAISTTAKKYPLTAKK